MDKQRQSIIAIDFDDTITENVSYLNEVGEFQPYAKEVLLELQKRGYVLVLNTLRDSKEYSAYLAPALEFLKSNGLKFMLPKDFKDFNKIPADIFIDDRNFGGFPGWEKVAEFFDIKLEDKSEK